VEVRQVVPILNVSDVEESVAWFAKLGLGSIAALIDLSLQCLRDLADRRKLAQPA
jgi:hypothetical protein